MEQFDLTTASTTYYVSGSLNEQLYGNLNGSTAKGTMCVDDQVSTPSIYQTVVFFLLALVTVSLNLVLIVVVLKTKGLRRKTNYILVSMAGADFLVGLISEPIWGLALWVDEEDKIYITTAKFVAHFSLMSSVCHLLVVTLERTVAVLKPLHYRVWITCSRVRLIVSTTWIWSFFVAVLHPFLWTDYSYYLFIVWTGFSVLMVVAVLHIMMLCALRRATMALKDFSSNAVWYENARVSDSAAVKNARLRERKKTKLVTIITLLFAVCILPSVFAETMCYFDKITQKIKNSINLLFFLNSFMNPIIFAMREPKFRSALKTMLGCSSVDNLGSSQSGSRSNLRINPSRSDTSEICSSSNQASNVNLFQTTEPGVLRT